jgi:hypothetical protein
MAARGEGGEGPALPALSARPGRPRKAYAPVSHRKPSACNGEIGGDWELVLPQILSEPKEPSHCAGIRTSVSGSGSCLDIPVDGE